MLMTNEYGSAFKRAHSEEEMLELSASGWRRVEENPKPAVPAPEEQKIDSPTVEAPRIVERESNRLMYKNRYLSQWAQVGKKEDLMKILEHFGIPYSSSSSKNDMQKALRQYIYQTKEEKRSGDK